MIEVDGLRKEFGSTLAVNDISFRVKRGEIIGLLGPNGSGKTTIMRILAAFFPPTSGRVCVGGLDVERDSLAVRRKIGYLPENVQIYSDLTVTRFLMFCAEVRGFNGVRRRKRVAQVIEDVGLGTVRRKRIGKLSKGYRQRVGIAQALIHEPEVLILDEPTVGLDPSHVLEMRALIRGLAGRSTVILSTHVLPEVSVTCDRVIIVKGGRIALQDTVEGLRHRVSGVVKTLLRVEGPIGEIVRVLGAIPGVEGVIERSVTGGASDQLLISSKDETVRKDIARAVVEARCHLIEMSPVSTTLEDLFVRLVRETGGED